MVCVLPVLPCSEEWKDFRHSCRSCWTGKPAALLSTGPRRFAYRWGALPPNQPKSGLKRAGRTVLASKEQRANHISTPAPAWTHSASGQAAGGEGRGLVRQHHSPPASPIPRWKTSGGEKLLLTALGARSPCVLGRSCRWRSPILQPLRGSEVLAL